MVSGHNEQESKKFQAEMEARNFKMIGLSAEWNTLAYLVNESDTHQMIAFDYEDGTFGLCTVNKETINGDANGFTSGCEEWYEDAENYFKTFIGNLPDFMAAIAREGF